MNTSPLSGLLHSGEFTNESAYFLGAILAANEVHRITPKGEKIWLASVKHNSGQCPYPELNAHRDNLLLVGKNLSGIFYDKQHLSLLDWFPRNKDGFAFGFQSASTVTISDLCAYASYALSKASNISQLRRCMLLGAFDGRCSIDINRANASIRYISLDCGDDDAMNLLCTLLNAESLSYNSNYARDRLEGGEPRKPQLRIAARSARSYGERIGFISSHRMAVLKEALPQNYEWADSSDILKGLHVLKWNSGISPKYNMSESSVAPKVGPTIKIEKDVEGALEEKQLPKVKKDYAPYKQGACVVHKSFGNGTILDISNGKIIIQFGSEKKMFQFPQAIESGFIKLR